MRDATAAAALASLGYGLNGDVNDSTATERPRWNAITSA
jgi:hypothetical protein